MNNMLLKTLRLAVLFLFLAGNEAAADMLFRGVVLSVAPERGELTVQLLPCPNCVSAESSPPTPELVWTVQSEVLPPCVAPNQHVRIWGEVMPERNKYIRARRIAGPGGHHERDSTGVRSRLRRRCLMNEHHQHPSATTGVE